MIVEDTTVDYTTRRFLISTPSKSLVRLLLHLSLICRILSLIWYQSSRKPVIKLRVSSSILPVSNSKETKVNVTLSGFAFSFFLDTQWISDLMELVKNPPQVWNSLIPTPTCTNFFRLDFRISCAKWSYTNICEDKRWFYLCFWCQEYRCSCNVYSRDNIFDRCGGWLWWFIIPAPCKWVCLAFHWSHRRSYPSWLPAKCCLVDCKHFHFPLNPVSLSFTQAAGYALLAEVGDLNLNVIRQVNPRPSTKVCLQSLNNKSYSPLNPDLKVLISRVLLRLHLCADTLSSLTPFFADLGNSTSNGAEESK